MLLNLWNLIDLRCGNHEEDFPKMELDKSTHSVFYGCTCTERKCENRVSIDDYDKLIAKITKDIESAEFKNEMPDLTGNKYVIRGIIYKVYKHKQDKIVIDVVNNKVKR